MLSYDNLLSKGFVSPALLAGLDESAPVLVAFSGGADSTALLTMTANYAKLTGADVYAAHVNHMIRGAEADRDEEFCRSVASSLGVKLFVHRFDVPKYAELNGLSIETAARNVRYDFFDSVMKENGIRILATAHNANDNLETQIFNLTRGCGLDGICGIPQTRPCKHGTVVRPILRMSREEILAFCRENGLSFVTDSTNTDTEYTRNMIRAQIIPALEKINSAAVKNASRLSVSLRDDALCLDGMAEWFLEEMNEDASFEIEKLLGSPPAIANRAIRALYSHVSGGATLEHVHVAAIRKLCESAVPHSSLDLPNNTVARIENKRLYLDEKREEYSPPEDYCVELEDGVNRISATDSQIIIGNSQNTKNIYKNSILLYLDSAKINGALIARNRHPGDKIKIRGMNKSVKKLLCDMKIPLDIRYRLPVICDSDGIVAIPFVSARDGIQLKGNTGNTDVLKLQFILF